MAPDLDVRRDVVEEARIEVASDDGARRTNLVGEPPGDRTGPRADLETAPARTDADALEHSDRGRVRPALEQLQSGALGIVRAIAEDVSLPIHELAPAPRRYRAVPDSNQVHGHQGDQDGEHPPQGSSSGCPGNQRALDGVGEGDGEATQREPEPEPPVPAHTLVVPAPLRRR